MGKVTGLIRLLSAGTPVVVKSLALGHDPTVRHSVRSWTIGHVYTACELIVLFSLVDEYSELTKVDCMACIAGMSHEAS